MILLTQLPFIRKINLSRSHALTQSSIVSDFVFSGLLRKKKKKNRKKD